MDYYTSAKSNGPFHPTDIPEIMEKFEKHVEEFNRRAYERFGFPNGTYEKFKPTHLIRMNFYATRFMSGTFARIRDNGDIDVLMPSEVAIEMHRQTGQHYTILP